MSCTDVENYNVGRFLVCVEIYLHGCAQYELYGEVTGAFSDRLTALTHASNLAFPANFKDMSPISKQQQNHQAEHSTYNP